MRAQDRIDGRRTQDQEDENSLGFLQCCSAPNLVQSGASKEAARMFRIYLGARDGAPYCVAHSKHRSKWGRERDSNRRYGFPYSGFQDIWIEGVLTRIKCLAAGQRGRERVNGLSFGNYCSPQFREQILDECNGPFTIVIEDSGLSWL
jgi:hypothetical protein